MQDSLNKIIQHLQSMQDLQSQVRQAGLQNKLEELQAWQCKRLLASHADLWAQKRFRPAMQFFIDELYGPKDFSQRDQEIAQIVPKMGKILPNKALMSLASALHLNQLSLQLDFILAEKLVDMRVDRHSYAQAYKASDNASARLQQLEFIQELGNALADVIHIKGISMLLMVSRKPAKLAGVLSLHQFLESGYRAFRQLGQVDDFVRPIVTREKQLSEQLFSTETFNPLPEGL